MPHVLPDDVRAVSASFEGQGPPRPIAPEDSPSVWSHALFPFRPALGIRSTSPGVTSVVSVPFDIPAEGGTLETAIAVHPRYWAELPESWFSFALEVESGSGRSRVFEAKLDPVRELTDRGWFDVSVDLAPWADQTVRLRFVNGTEKPRRGDLAAMGWAEPRLNSPIRPSRR
jgi:hypothetical protein